MQFNGNQFGPQQFAPPSISGQIQASQNAYAFGGSPSGYGQGTASNYGMGMPQSFGSPYTGGPVGWTAPQMVSPGSSQTTSVGYNSYAFQPSALPWGNFGPSGGASQTTYTPPTYMQQPIYQQPQQPLIQQVPVPIEVPKLVQVPVPYQVQVPTQQDDSPTVINNVINPAFLFGMMQQMQAMQAQTQTDTTASAGMNDEDSSAMMMMMTFMPMMMNMMSMLSEPVSSEPIIIDPSLSEDPSVDTPVTDGPVTELPTDLDLTDNSEDPLVDGPGSDPVGPPPATTPIASPPLPTPAPVNNDAEILQLIKDLRKLGDPNYVAPSTPVQEREMLGRLDLRITPETSGTTKATSNSSYSVGDPHFKHFRSNQTFDVQAVGTYNYISDRNLQVNSELAPYGNNASVNIRTGIKIADLDHPGQFKKILVDRDGTVTINGQAITAGSDPIEFATGIQGADGKLKKGFLKYENGSVTINSGEYEMKITIYQGSYIDFTKVSVTDAGIVADGRRSSGMLGDLADPNSSQNAATDNMGTGALSRPLADYKLAGTDLFGDDFSVNQFGTERLTRSEWGVGSGTVTTS